MSGSTECAHPIRIAVLAAVFAVLLMTTAACGLFETSSNSPLELDYAGTLPQSWTPIGTWREVNIDDDGETEYLLLFTYDQGQVGGAIYDRQISPDLVGVIGVSNTPSPTSTVELVPVPLQPLAYYRPYRLVPSMWSYTYGGDVGHGFLAYPDDAANITILQTPRPVLGEGAQSNATGSSTASSTPTSDTSDTGGETALSSVGDALVQPKIEMMIRGGDTHLTFVWWRNRLYGYGVTQLTAGAGFRGVDWTLWSSNPLPIDRIEGLQPLTDYRARSQLCRVIEYTREHDGAPSESDIAALPVISFSEQNLGLTFCRSTPHHPFYPEGVVMAYLEFANGEGGDTARLQSVEHLLTPGVSIESVHLDAPLIQLSEEMVDDIAAYKTVPAQPSVVINDDYVPTTTVCVEAVTRDNADERRWVLFNLRYQPPDFDNRLQDRWTITSAAELPAPPAGQSSGYCASILGVAPD